MIRRTRGFLLLPVALTLVVVGALAYAMTRDAGMSTARVDAGYDTDVARYLAEAAVNLARWNNNKTNCGNNAATFASTPLYRYSLATNKVGTTAADLVGTMTMNSASVVGNNSSSDKGNLTLDVSSLTTSAMANGTASKPAASLRIVRTVFRYNLGNQKTATITGGGGANTTISNTNSTPQGTLAYMELNDNGPGDQSDGLVRFSLGTLPKNALVKDATLRLKRTSGQITWSGIPALDIQRVTTPWDPATATWTFPWSKQGGDYAADRVATSLIADNRYYYWSLDGLVAGWMDGTLANNGLLLKPAYLKDTRFSAFTNSDGDGPQLTVNYYERCN